MAVLIATPSSSFLDVLKKIKDDINQIPLAWVSKGFDPLAEACFMKPLISS